MGEKLPNRLNFYNLTIQFLHGKQWIDSLKLDILGFKDDHIVIFFNSFKRYVLNSNLLCEIQKGWNQKSRAK